MAIGDSPIGDAPIAGDSISVVSTRTEQLSIIVSVNEPQPIQMKQLSVIVSVAEIQPIQTKLFAIIVSIRPVPHIAYHPPIKIAQTTPLFTIFDAPTNPGKD